MNDLDTSTVEPARSVHHLNRIVDLVRALHSIGRSIASLVEMVHPVKIHTAESPRPARTPRGQTTERPALTAGAARLLDAADEIAAGLDNQARHVPPAFTASMAQAAPDELPPHRTPGDPMTTRALRVTVSLMLTMMLVLAASASPSLGAKADKKKTPKKDPEPAPAAVIEVLKGDKYRMANSKMADRVVRIEDGKSDQVTNEGDAVPGAPAYSDLEAVYVAATKMQRKLLTKMAKDYPAGTAGSFYGADADWDTGQPAIFVAAQLTAKRPADATGQQIEVGVDGDAASLIQVGTSNDPYAGLERFSLSGIFNNGSWTSGSTDVSGREPGAAIELYNTTSGNFGFYDPKRATFYVMVPRAKDAQSITVRLRTSTPDGEVIDQLELPAGGAFIDLTDADGGFSAGAGLGPLTCRALETFSGSSTDSAPVDPDATLIRYTAGVTSAEAATADELLAPAIAAVGTLPMLVTEVGTDAEPLEVEAQLALAPGIDALTLTMEVPAGRWSFTPAEDAQIKLPNGQSLIDHRSLTGSAGVLTGPGLDGVVAGDPTCTAPPAATVEPSSEASPEPTDEA